MPEASGLNTCRMASESEELRQLGNVLYKQGKLYEGQEQFRIMSTKHEQDR